MPNHIQSNLKFICDEERLREILEAIKYESDSESEDVGYGTIDFQKIIPMPEALDIECGSRTDSSVELYLTSINPDASYFGTDKMEKAEFDSLVTRLSLECAHPYDYKLSQNDINEKLKYLKNPQENIEYGKQVVSNILNYGVPTWYEWRIANWGTKWNSYSNFYEGGSILNFQTAWSAPKAVLLKLSEMYPDVTMELEYADEDIGSNCGRAVFCEGELQEMYYPETRKEAIEFACSVWGYDLKETMGYYLNADGSDYINPEGNEYELLSIAGKPALFSNERLTTADIPEGTYVYYLRDSDEGDAFATLERNVQVNFGGSIITNEELDFGESDYIDLINEDNSPNFFGYEISLLDFMEGNFDVDESMSEMTQ